MNRPEPVKALLVPANQYKAAKVVTVEQTPEAMQKLVGGWLENVSTGSREWHAYCDEEGKLKGSPINPRATRLAGLLGWRRRDVLCGDVVFLGIGEDGEEADVPNLVLGQMAMLETGTS